VVPNNDYPSTKLIDRLISAHKAFQDFFRFTDSGGECVPVFMLQCDEPKSFANYTQFETAWKTGYDQEFIYPEQTTDLREVEKEFGPVMAENFYKFTGGWEGPMTQLHAAKVLAAINGILMEARKVQIHG